MKRWIKTLATALMCALLPGCAAAEQRVELFAVNVGKGDALLVRVDDYACLIDAGKAKARGKIMTALAYMGIERLDAVFLTHPDDDHAGGLEWLAASDIEVGVWYASGIFTEVKEKKHPALRAAQARGQEVQWLERGDRVPLGDTGAVFEVLAPEIVFSDKDDNNSLVMMLETHEGRVLFTGDMELPQEAQLLTHGDDLSCVVLKAPNHGDDDTLSAAFARAASAQIAIISTDSYEKPGTPDPGVVARLQDAGSAVVVTQDAALGILTAVKGGVPTVSPVGIDAPEAEGVAIRSVAPGNDLITVGSAQSECDLSGWTLCSAPGNELFIFPEGTVLRAGASLTIGTKSSDEGSYDLFWDEKNAIHKSKTDVVTLYDAYGRAVDSATNGL